VLTSPALFFLLAQDPPPPTSGETIIVEDTRVAAARKELENAILDMGYHIKHSGDGRTVYRPDVAWHPTIVVDDDGFVLLRRSPAKLGVDPKITGGDRVLAWVFCPLDPSMCVHLGGQVVSKNKLDWKKAAANDATNEQRIAWDDALHDRGQARRIAELSGALDLLWTDGVPIDAPGAPRLATPPERKTALVEFWATRTDTPEGEEVRALVRDFLLYEVSESPWPVADADREHARLLCDCDPDF
jgi:hypothetical protein